ncbi:MAG: UvrD-helicase domain-containing protein [Treponema sp.]|jgi:DNA helicase-2/ATP-dependent DNA helicase PcrA|nr:UvrD-helicase domain-containing protein [Treponema sp.]
MPPLNIEAELNGPQLKAVTSLEGPVLIIAGAGSGKTRVITYRMARMLETGIHQSNILSLTFTNKAAREMEKRVKELTGKKLHNLTVSTFHAFGLKILREEIECLDGYRKNFSIYDETDRMQLVKDSLRECRLSVEGVDLYSLGQTFSNIKIGRYRWSDAPEAAALSSAPAGTADSSWEPVYREYQQSLKVYNALDFDDLLTLPIAIFEGFPAVREKYRARYRYIMVDEFQDTSLIQYRLMRLLAGRNICVVGDDDQSIYSWRGANYENIVKFEADFPDVKEIKLEQNYRSTTTILEAANGVISNNTNRKEKRLWSGKKEGKPIELVYPRNESEEADFIAGRITDLRLQDNLRYDEFGVLVRTNSMIRIIEEAFLAQNIPYKVSGGTSFFQHKEIKDIISYLRIIANSNDDVNLLRIINTPRRGIGKGAITGIGELARKNQSCLWDAMMRFRFADAGDGQLAMFGQDGLSPGKVKAEIDEFVNLIEFFRSEMIRAQGRKGWTLSEQVRSLVNNIDYRSYLASEYSKNEKIARWKFTNIEYLIQSIVRWESDPDNLDPGLYPYLNRISLITRDDGEDEAEKGKVNLMTIHASKGLEFPVVFIAGAEAGIIPHERSIEEGEGTIEEERRLFYVAITRARDKLYISSCRKRRRLQSTVECQPSPFLEEIPPHLIGQQEDDSGKSEEEKAAEFFALMREKFN